MGKDKESTERKRSVGFHPDFLAMLPKKIAATIKNVTLESARKKLPDELANYFQKVQKKLGADFLPDISRALIHLRKRSASDFEEGSIAQSLARNGKITSAIMHDNPTFAATVPVALQRFTQQKSELIGSGVLIRIYDRTFLLTAAHVADFKSEGSIMIPGKDNFVSPGGWYYTMNLPTSGNRGDDKLDVAYVCLDNDSEDDLHSSCKILEHQDLSLEVDTSRTIYTFAGYPWRLGKVKNGVIETDFSTMTSGEVQKKDYEALGLNQSRHIVIRFNRERTFSERHKRVVVSPLPSGMSGGGVYAWSEKALKSWPVRLPLAGIVTEFIADKRLLVATRLEVYIRCIVHSHPALFTNVGEG
ncbi:MAG: hypothetical protein ABI042_17605 [Verrucomicrobiota bacterium]